MATEVVRPAELRRWRLVVRECGWEVRLLARNPLAGVLLVVLPVMLLPLVHALNPHVRVMLPGTPRLRGGVFGFSSVGGTNSRVLTIGGATTISGPALYDQYLAPVLAAFGIAVGCFANLAIGLTFAREDGTLKRLRGTPLPPWVHLAGRIASSVVLSVAIAATTIAGGVGFYGVATPARLLPASVVTVIIGAAVFCALGVAMTSALPNADVAPAAVFAVLLPMAFISNTFYPPQVEPAWMRMVARWLPLEPLTTALAGAFNPGRPAPGWAIGKLAALAAGAAVLWFRWCPASERTRRRSPLVRRVAVAMTVVAVVASSTVIWLNRAPVPGSAQSLDVGALDAIPRGATAVRTIDLNAVRDLPANLRDFSVGARSSDLRLLLHRADSTVTVVSAGSNFGGCDVVDRGMVDAGWLGVVAVHPSAAVFIDTCTGSVFDAMGSCVGGRCEPLLLVPADIRRGDIILHLDKATFTARGVNAFLSRPAAIPGVGAAAYQTNGSEPTIQVGDLAIAVPPTVTVILDNNGLRLLGPPDRQPTLDLTLRSQSPLAGTIQGIGVGPGPPFSWTLASRPLRWLSLPVGQNDQVSAADVASVITRTGPTSWTIQTTSKQGTFTMAMATDQPLPPWRTLSVDFSGKPFGQQLRATLRLTRLP
jgi:ABC-2 type transport system permease protein